MTLLEPMDQRTFEAWRGATVREYAEEKVAAGAWPSDDGVVIASPRPLDQRPSVHDPSPSPWPS